MLTEDDAVIIALRLPNGRCSPTHLIGYTPGRAVRAMGDAGVLGNRMAGFGPAVELCTGGQKLNAFVLPLQMLLRR